MKRIKRCKARGTTTFMTAAKPSKWPVVIRCQRERYHTGEHYWHSRTGNYVHEIEWIGPIKPSFHNPKKEWRRRNS